MAAQELHVVTGAFGYAGRYIAARLLQAGHRVRTLTNSVSRANPFGSQVEARPLCFADKARLVESLCGATAFYNTYWVRFNYGSFSHSTAVENTLKLFEACREAGVGRVVHISITNASEQSPLEYFHGKGRLERALLESGLSHAILRPAVLFGKEDILINNIAWCLRRFPVFAVFGNGQYRLQPIYVDDLAELAVRQGRERRNAVINAVGPETFAYRDLVRTIGAIIGKPRPIMSLPPSVGCVLGWHIGKLRRDVLITREEIRGLMQELLYTPAPPAGATRLTDWAQANAATLGLHYHSELARRRDRRKPYSGLA